MTDTLCLTKHHGLGNDFLVLVDLDDRTPVDAAMARAWCDRHRGVGADGLIRVTSASPSTGSPGADIAGGDTAGPRTGDADTAGAGTRGGRAASGTAGNERPDRTAEVAMTLRNADGTPAEMSGNGIRCLGQAVARHRGVATLDLVVATAAGLRQVRVRPGPGECPATVLTPPAVVIATAGGVKTGSVTAWVEVDMGPARPGPGSVVVTVGLAPTTKMATVDMGNPHLVLLVDDPAAVDLAELGPSCQDNFPGGINVEVVAPAPGEPDTLDLRVWERGVGLTQACGTGACAVAHAAHEWGLVGEQVRVRMPGGEVDVHLGATVTLAGPATFVAEIHVPVADVEAPVVEGPQ